MTTRGIKTATALAAFALPLAMVAPASASGSDREVRTNGGCSGSAHWKLKAKADDGRIEVEGEVDSNKTGQIWQWRFKHNGSVSATGKATTAGRSGSFSVERRMANLAGTDKFVFRAVHGSQVCRGTISF